MRCRSRTSSPRSGKVLPNGRMVYDMYLFQVKKPEESKGEWDMYKQLAKVPGDEAFCRSPTAAASHAIRLQGGCGRMPPFDPSTHGPVCLDYQPLPRD